MGLNVNGTRLLLSSMRQGIDFSKTLTIGRQGLYIQAPAFQKNLRDFGFGNIDHQALLEQQEGFAEPFLRLLGAEVTDSMDVSDYEKATVIHDMNHPVPDTLKEKYSVVLEGGSLEHIFNFPTAIKNCMEMVRPGGYFLGISPTNNYMGHGFYQFSPELYFRIFDAANGFELQDILFFNDTKNIRTQRQSKFYKLKDPARLNRRVELTNAYPSYLYIVAKRVEVKPIFEKIPQQSDYAQVAWMKKQKDKSKRKKKVLLNWFRRVTPDAIRDMRRNLRLLSKPFGNGIDAYFEPVNLDQHTTLQNA